MCAARGLDLRAPLRPAPGTGAALAARARAACPGPGPDRFLSPELAAAEELVGSRRAARKRSSRAIGALR